MAHWSTVRRTVTLLVLLMAASEIFACRLISPDSCVFSALSVANNQTVLKPFVCQPMRGPFKWQPQAWSGKPTRV
jgi:hypothetical protein